MIFGRGECRELGDLCISAVSSLYGGKDDLPAFHG